MNAFSKTVHPHGRGDNATTHRLRKTTSGSPPRAWGQSRLARSCTLRKRFTPTGEGTICRYRPIRKASSVHPHGRGDNRSRCASLSATHGSPPRAWGQSLRCSAHQCCWRFTPTGVGTISRSTYTIHLHTVHPHGRGDNDVTAGCYIADAGSPPRAWGQSLTPSARGARGRFTPTGVGTMTVQTMALIAPSGSPPRAWGQ